MKIVKRIWLFTLVYSLMMSLGLSCFCADVVVREVYLFYDYSNDETSSLAFRENLNVSNDLKSASYAKISGIKDAEVLKGIDCSTYAENTDSYSMYDYLYLTAAYASLSVTLNSGETFFVEEVVVSNGESYALAEISSLELCELDKNDSVKDFESNHIVYNRLSKYPIEFDHDRVVIEKIIFEPLPKTSGRR